MIDENEKSGTSMSDDSSGANPHHSSAEDRSKSYSSQDDQQGRKRFSGGSRYGRQHTNHRGRHGRRPPGRYRPAAHGGVERAEDDSRLMEMIRDAERKLTDSTQPVQLENLNAFERKRIHQYFERRKPAFETKTYRGEGESQVLWIFPVANLKKFAEEKAKEALDTGAEVALPPMSNYERFLIHDALKALEDIETVSAGEGAERHIEIMPKKFGRGLKKIMKKIKLL